MRCSPGRAVGGGSGSGSGGTALLPCLIPTPPSLPNCQQVEKGLCEREFAALRGCWARAFRAALARIK